MEIEEISKQPLILSGINLEDEIQSWVTKKQASGIFILVDEHTHDLCLPVLISKVPTLKDAIILEVEAGEESKSIEIVSGLWESLLENGASRKSLLINLGGGMITDLGGFVASTYMRGISFANIPTSLLAMVDASCGGKTGINFSSLKNNIGTFANADAVFVDASYLKTLPDREFRSGTAEIIKHVLLQGEDSWEIIRKQDFSNTAEMQDIIASSIRFKKRITDEDFLETGIREQLNLGHTIAHALESLYIAKGKILLHGEAVAAGLVMETQLAFQQNTGLHADTVLEIESFIRSLFPVVSFRKEDFPDLLKSMRNDKKNKSDAIFFSLLESIGHCLPSQPVAEELILLVLNDYIHSNEA